MKLMMIISSSPIDVFQKMISLIDWYGACHSDVHSHHCMEREHKINLKSDEVGRYFIR